MSWPVGPAEPAKPSSNVPLFGPENQYRRELRGGNLPSGGTIFHGSFVVRSAPNQVKCFVDRHPVQFREREELRTRRFKVRGTRYLFRSADSTCGASNCLSSQSAFNRSRLNALWPCQDENQRNFLRARIDLETVLHLKTI